VPRGSFLVGWVADGRAWTRIGEVPVPLPGAATVVEPVGRRPPEAFLLTAEEPGTSPARPGRKVLSSR
jgi:hypothetical protein